MLVRARPTLFAALLAAFAIASPMPVGLAQSPSPRTSRTALAGVWTISPDAQLRGPDNQSPPTGRVGGRRGRGGSGGGGFSGGGFGGGGGGFGGASGREDAERLAAQQEAIADFSSALMNPVRQMTIAITDPSVEIAFDDGRRLSFETTNKKVDGRAENGLVRLTRRSRWDGDALLTEITIENGPTFQQRYELIAEGAQLRVVTTADATGGRDATAKRTVTRVYERPDANGSAYSPPAAK